MKLKQYIVLILATITAAAGCRKDKAEPVPLSSITITNVVVGGAQAMLGNHTATIQNINNNSGVNFSIPAGKSQLYVWPVGDSLHPYYNQSLTSAPQEIYSLFLTGTPAAVDTLLIRENLPVHNDSTFGVRFINLAPGSPAVKLTLSTSATVSELGDVSYKQASAFKIYPASSTNTTYNFQIRNAATDALISSVAFSGTSAATGIPRFNNITLVLRGLVNGTPAAGITRVNHYFKL